MLRVNAVCVKQQFFGAHPLDHEVAVLALRRFNQLDVEAQAVSKYLLWREVLEPDFSVSICFAHRCFLFRSALLGQYFVF